VNIHFRTEGVYNLLCFDVANSELVACRSFHRHLLQMSKICTSIFSSIQVWDVWDFCFLFEGIDNEVDYMNGVE